MAIVFREDLDAALEGHTESQENGNMFFLHSKCHPRAGTWASYMKDSGVITIMCKECGTQVVELAIASRHEPLRSSD